MKYQVDVDAVVATFPEMRRGNVAFLHQCCFFTLSLYCTCLVHRENDDESFLVLHLYGEGPMPQF